MANISLNKSVRTCKVNTGWAERIQSDRFENSDLMMCPVWNERDLSGREVCADSFYTKREGCNSSLDRIDVENDLRPKYIEYVTLDAAGIDATMYDENVGVTESFKYPKATYRPKGQRENLQAPTNLAKARYPFGKSAIRENFVKQMYYDDAVSGCQTLENTHKYTGQFGQNNFRADIQPTCPQYSYEYAMAQVAQAGRDRQMSNLGAQQQSRRAASYSSY